MILYKHKNVNIKHLNDTSNYENFNVRLSLYVESEVEIQRLKLFVYKVPCTRT